LSFDTSQKAHQAFRAIVAEGTNPTLAWVGSGLSLPAGLPAWSDLRATLLEALEDKARGFDGDDRERLEATARVIRLEKNHWAAFSMLEDNLGKATYKDTIREAFAPAAKAPMPSTYMNLWKLRVRGILNLNIDRLATRALLDVRDQGAQIGEYNGREVRDVGQILNGRLPFVVNLHGTIDDSTSWVLTRQSLKSLTESDPYRTFIDACLATRTILFVGLSADDVAVGGHLERLAKSGVQTGTHFWLTDRGDAATDEWAEQVGIRRIRYRSTDGKHDEIDEFFADLTSYVSPEPTDPLPPVTLDGTPQGEDSLPPQAELEQLDAENIRKVLNAHAQRLLHSDERENYDAYEEFSRQYDGAIYRAWYTSDQEGRNSLLDYTLEKEIALGAFGRVYRATGRDGEQVAVKVLLEEVRRNPELLRSFRRGVRSMRILHDHNVDGMVAYLEGSEIPAFVVMEWIEGPNLTEASEAKQITDWDVLLKIATELARIIRSAHALPERVLHRDIRPSNVMLSGFYVEPDDWKVVVLDFDLSWHKGAYEKSVLHTSSAGFLAPEQVRTTKNASTRHAGVDAFGIGMTLYYLCGGVEPLPDQHKHVGWVEHVREVCNRFARGAWLSLPTRLARLIVAATQDEQSSRWDLAEIVSELDQLRAASERPDIVSSIELVTEELAAHCDVFSSYEWDADRVSATKELPTGLRVELSADIKEQKVRLTFWWRRTETQNRSDVRKYIVAAADGMFGQLTSAGWKKLNSKVEPSAVHYEGEVPVDSLAGQIPSYAEKIDDATMKVRQLSTKG